jgi:hypothetical protein
VSLLGEYLHVIPEYSVVIIIIIFYKKIRDLEDTRTTTPVSLHKLLTRTPLSTQN